MPQPICPSADSLRDFALGRAEDSDFEHIAEHVELCLTCQSHLEGLDQSGDPLVEHLQKLSTNSVSETTAEEQLWASAVLAGPARAGSIRIAADAGIGLARRLREGPVYLDRFELRSELGVGSFGYVFAAGSWSLPAEKPWTTSTDGTENPSEPEEPTRRCGCRKFWILALM